MEEHDEVMCQSALEALEKGDMKYRKNGVGIRGLYKEGALLRSFSDDEQREARPRQMIP